MESFEQLRKGFYIPEIKERNYWFVRTEGGSYFKDFYQNGYIAIGWEYLTPEIMKKNPDGTVDEESIKKLIAQKENRNLKLEFDDEEFETLSPEEQKQKKLKLRSDKSHVTSIFNKIHKFLYNLEIGDVVVVPSYNSDYIAIGTITSEVFVDMKCVSKFEASIDVPDYSLCPYTKRREVRWHTKIQHNDLEIFLQNALKPQQAMTSLNEYAPYINRNIYSIYTEGEYIHSVFRTFQNGDLTLAQLTDFTNALTQQLELINKNSDSIVSADDIKIKLNVHSPGIIEVIGAGVGTVTTVIAFIGVFMLNKHGGKLNIKVTGENEITFETKGKEGIKLENEKIKIENRKLDIFERELDIIERCLGNPDYKEKLDALSSLNLQVPPIYQIESQENIEKEME